MENKQKLTNLLKLKVAKDKGEEIFVIGNRLDELEDKIGNINGADLTEIVDKIEKLDNKLDEEIIVELNIVNG